MNMLSFLPYGLRPRSRKGVALIVVLGSLIFLSALILAFLSSVKTELVVSKAYAENNAVGSLVNTSVNIVMGQIRQATTASPTNSWTSQPGLIRTFSNAGLPDQSYKLYSSDVMQLDGPLDPMAEAATMAQWAQQTAIYTDLNQPASGSYPVLDPAASGPVEGFSVTGAPATAAQSVPMPAKWLYVLKDGTLAAPDDPGTASTTTATFINSTNKPAAGNPIVGRIAFWTDDESCKVNVNTASEGTYWDVPKAWNVVPGSTTNGLSERKLAEHQPTTGEYQGYPGHPASTSLSAVFPELIPPTQTTLDPIFKLVPRLQNEGSKGLTVPISTAANVTLDSDRLYATEDESIFDNARSSHSFLTSDLVERGMFFLTNSSRAPETNLFSMPRIACWPVHSNASTVYRTAFDRLIAFCAKLNGDDYFFQRQNPFSMTEDYESIGRNQQLLAYLRQLTSNPVPGFGGNLGTKYGTDRDQILTEIFDYIRTTNTEDANLARANQYAPGTDEAGTTIGGGDFGRGQVLPIRITGWNTRGFGRVPVITEVGLWLICAGSAPNASLSPSNSIDAQIIAANAESNNPATNFALAAGTSLTSDATTREIRIEAAAVLEPFIPLEGYKNIQPDIEILVDGLQNWTIRGNAAGQSEQNLGMPSASRLTASDAGQYVTGSLLTFTGVYPRGGHVGVWSFMGNRGMRARNSGRLGQDSSRFSNLTQQYPFVGEPLTVRILNSTPQVIFSGGPISVTLRSRRSGDVVQSYDLDFPSGTFPAPNLQTNPGKSWTLQAGGSGVTGGRLAGAGGAPPYYFQGNTPIGSSSLSDTTRTILPAYTNSGTTQSADFRLLAMKDDVASTDFVKHPRFDTTSSLWRVANSFVQHAEGHSYHMGRNSGQYNTRISDLGGASISLAKGVASYGHVSHPDAVLPATDAQNTGDWDNGVGVDIDGPYLNKPDEGVAYATVGATNIPYYHSFQTAFAAEKFYSPNRIMPSPGMFGSLPTGVKRGRHWETLLFRRQPGHPNYPVAAGSFTQDPDYLWLDLFWMPVVEPYAISEPLSTAGKINMNQQIVPFSWIQRYTGLHAILKNERVITIPNTEATMYKKNPNLSAPFSNVNFRQPVKISDTLIQFTQRFNNSDGTGLYAFRSAAEICDMHIIPDNASPSTASKTALDTDMAAYWAAHSLTGDNSRERIYTTVYPRLTTRSNTFRVHYRVQTLKKLNTTPANQWAEPTDLVTGEGRGSVLVERYIDANDTSLPDYGADPTAPSLEAFYQFRVLSVKRFDP
jgi:uncharacterized protein (TIGR02600 family)